MRFEVAYESCVSYCIFINKQTLLFILILKMQLFLRERRASTPSPFGCSLGRTRSRRKCRLLVGCFHMFVVLCVLCLVLALSCGGVVSAGGVDYYNALGKTETLKTFIIYLFITYYLFIIFYLYCLYKYIIIIL